MHDEIVTAVRRLTGPGSHPAPSLTQDFWPGTAYDGLMADSLTEDQLVAFMRAAIAEGRRALPACLPNPPVGCVLVRDGQMVARGHTQPPFENHAEPMALAQLEGELSDVTAFVTLEPCSFHERTPSCAKEMIRRGVGTTYVACIDPHPKNRGRGVEMLRESGMRVITGFLTAEAQPDLDPYLIREADGH